MRSSNKIPQKIVTRLVDYGVAAGALTLHLQQVDVRPGRTDIQIGMPFSFTVPETVWHDHKAAAVAIGQYHAHLHAKNLEQAALVDEMQMDLF